MKRIVIAFALALAASVSQAGVIHTVLDPGYLTSQVPSVTTVDFNNGTCGAYTNCFGDGALVTGSVSGRYATPYLDNTRYLSIPFNHSSGSATFTTPGSYNYFGLYWGSLDDYNSISFYNGATLVRTFGGTEIWPLLANGGQTSWSSNRYVNFFFTDGALFNRIVFTSTNFAFESDNHAFGNIPTRVPEPGTLALFSLGLIGVGVAARRRRATR
ncbi:MAG TPA: PEP-CTERM sorting domain-containing protein [Steroidobacteraceae bacterium]|jgi:hypothetical protein